MKVNPILEQQEKEEMSQKGKRKWKHVLWFNLPRQFWLWRRKIDQHVKTFSVGEKKNLNRFLFDSVQLCSQTFPFFSTMAMIINDLWISASCLGLTKEMPWIYNTYYLVTKKLSVSTLIRTGTQRKRVQRGARAASLLKWAESASVSHCLCHWPQLRINSFLGQHSEVQFHFPLLTSSLSDSTLKTWLPKTWNRVQCLCVTERRREREWCPSQSIYQWFGNDDSKEDEWPSSVGSLYFMPSRRRLKKEEEEEKTTHTLPQPDYWKHDASAPPPVDAGGGDDDDDCQGRGGHVRHRLGRRPELALYLLLRRGRNDPGQPRPAGRGCVQPGPLCLQLVGSPLCQVALSHLQVVSITDTLAGSERAGSNRVSVLQTRHQC